MLTYTHSHILKVSTPSFNSVLPLIKGVCSRQAIVDVQSEKGYNTISKQFGTQQSTLVTSRKHSKQKTVFLGVDVPAFNNDRP